MLHNKYRPKSWDEVVGHDEAVASIQSILKNNESGSFLLSGPAGVGKTSIARLIAAHKRIEGPDLMEVDAGVYTGIDAIRDLVATVTSTPMVSDGKCVIMDECHALSRQAWDGLLKAVEEPPRGVYWVFCTTNPSKVPATIKSRCYHFDLQPLPIDEIFAFLSEVVVPNEGLEIDEDVLYMVAEASEGSVRRALVPLAALVGVTDRKQAKEILRKQVDRDDIHDLCRMICLRKGMTWNRIVKLVARIRESGADPEFVRVKILRYAASTLLNMKDDPNKSMWLLYLMEQFRGEYNKQEGYAPLLVDLGHLVFDED